MAGAGAEVGWPQGPQQPRLPGLGKATHLFVGPEPPHSSRLSNHSKSGVGTTDLDLGTGGISSQESSFSAWWPTRGRWIFVPIVSGRHWCRHFVCVMSHASLYPQCDSRDLSKIGYVWKECFQVFQSCSNAETTLFDFVFQS